MTTDRDAVWERYRIEREKRLRADGNEQYVEMVGRYAHYLDDPYVPPVERAPLADWRAAGDHAGLELRSLSSSRCP